MSLETSWPAPGGTPSAEHCSHGGRLFERVGSTLDHPEARETCVPADVLDAWYPPAPAVVRAVEDNLAWLLHTSPPCRADGLRERLAAHLGLPSRHLMVGAGSSDLIFRLMPMLFKGRRVGIVSPAYGEYAHVLTANGNAEVVRIHAGNDHFTHTASHLLSEVERHRLDGLCLINPCNPTGQVLAPEQMDALVTRLPASCTLVVDETYIGYVGRESSLAARACQLPNLVVIESLSKIFAFSGIRAGVAVGTEALASALERELATYHIGTITTLAVARALDEGAYYQARLQETRSLRSDLRQALDASGLFTAVLPSAINAVLVDCGPARGAEALRVSLADQGVYVRNIEDQGLTEAQRDRFLRIAVLDAARNARTVAALHAIRREGLVAGPTAGAQA
ncbi:MAG: histidinol-phosphate transaminase [Candidatus Sericytochromatia bacterium]|nr:histidinol-phosphate transaminase [Candidatus Sericytochromatia bacterium]